MTGRPAGRGPIGTMVVSGILCLFGVAMSSYLTWAHFTSAKNLACPESSVINCVKVTTSPESVILGVPVAVAGLAFFVVMAALCSPWAWWSSSVALRRFRIGGAVVGVAMILYLLYVELFRLDAICLECTSIHVTTVLLFFTIAFGSVALTSADPPAVRR